MVEGSARVFAEGDRDRLIHRLTAVTGGDLPSAAIAQLADGDLSIVEPLPLPSQQAVYALLVEESPAAGRLEKMVGAALDYVPVAYLDLARISANAVGRVVGEQRQAIGTSILVSGRLLLTNNHVTPDSETAAAQLVQFDHELQVDGVPRVPTEFRLDPTTFFWTSPEAELDATLVAVGAPVSGSRSLAEFGMASLSAAQDKHAEGDFVTIVQHPEGDYKQIALRENRVIGRGKGGRTLHYGADTMPGSSGSPVFNDQFSIVALHHAGGVRNERMLEDGSAVPDDSNEGIRISAIVKELRGVLDTLTDGFRALLAEALDPPTTGPRLAAAPPTPPGAVEAAAEQPPTASGGAPPLVVGKAGADVLLPIRIDLATGVAAAVPTAAPATTTGMVERNAAPDPNYAKRKGYDPDFLSRSIPLPVLSDAQLAVAALPEGSDRSPGSLLLAYFHFSVVQNAARRQPFFTAVNIDGKRLRSINRTTGEVEATETWYPDPRIPPGDQLDQSIFERQVPRFFDRGHLVRRLDPAWGTAETALRASLDTFHFTNCSPQISAFNQRAALWAGIENFVLNNARAEKLRVTAITGPIFSDDDPEYRGIQVPRAFWKLVLRVEGNQLRCTAFLASQADLLVGVGDGAEAFDELGRVEVFQSSVTLLGERTGLDFQGLHAFDTMNLEVATEAVSLQRFDDVQW